MHVSHILSLSPLLDTFWVSFGILILRRNLKWSLNWVSGYSSFRGNERVDVKICVVSLSSGLLGKQEYNLFW
jgi:hypothetical protein